VVRGLDEGRWRGNSVWPRSLAIVPDMTGRRRLLGTGVVVSALTMAGFAVAAPGATGVAAPPAPPPVTRVAQPDFGNMVTAGGQTQWLQCKGKGPVTIVISPGWGDTVRSWTTGPDYAIFDRFAAMTRTCIMDRAGLGRSRPRQGAREATAGQQARELHAALWAAGERGPYIPLGHSYAGLIVRSFVEQFPNEIAGLELMDAATPNDYWGHWGNPEPVDLDTGNAQVGGMNRPKIGHKPLLVIGGNKGETADAEHDWLANQAKAVKLSKNAMRIVVRRGQHELQKAADWNLGQAGVGPHVDGRPALIKATRLLVHTVIAHGTFGGCSAAWQSLRAVCSVRVLP